MSTLVSTSSSPEITHMSADQITKLSAVYGDSDAVMAARVALVRRIVKSGISVKVMASDMRDAAASDASINAYSQATYGYANAASDVIDMTGVAFNDTTTAHRATIHRAAKHVGVKSLRDAVRNVLAPLEDSVLAPERLALVVDAAQTALTVTRSDRAPKNREPRPNDGVTDIDADVIDGETVGPARITVAPAFTALESIRAAVKFLQNGGEITRDMESAIAELTAAASAARKRTRALVTA